MSKTEKYYLNKNGEFVIENYHLAKPFSSFFPGIAGVWGVPIWAFYVNRGQAVSSFGIKTKDHPVMEFQPANKAYYLTSGLGFRTFIKMPAGKNPHFYDAFHNGVSSLRFNIENKMVITSYELRLNELNRTLGIEIDIEYFTIPNDNYGALARKVTIRNAGKRPKELEIIDGMPQVIPFGLNNIFLKQLSRTIEAWMCVENLDNNVAYLRLKVDPADRPEVIHINEGNFYLAFDKRGLKKPVVDPEAVFGRLNDFTYPSKFMEARQYSYPGAQMVRGKTPCCMSYAKFKLSPDAEYTLYSLAGNMDSLEKLKKNTGRIADRRYLAKKQVENKELISGLQSAVFTHSSSKSLDSYCAQNFLDNLMRGGYPLSVEHDSRDTRIQVFSRKHGDLERDYNRFLVEPTYFSQGNGNYRDVNQNRRCDIWFNPRLGEEAIFTFFNLIQSDGYNPLVIKPARFTFNQNVRAIKSFFNKNDTKKVSAFLREAFTPGELFSFIEQNGLSLIGRKRDFLSLILENSVKSDEAEHGEGFWIDHWHYCLDLLENYLLLYPENLRSLLFERKEFTFFDNTHTVKPRSQKYVLKNRKVYQYHSVAEDHRKVQLIKKRAELPRLSRIQNGQGPVCKTTLAAKMLTVIANKLSSLDPFGVGIEMEADKPGWYDSLNGLPGLLGSSVCETFELKRWILFLRGAIKGLALSGGYRIDLPYEVYDLLLGLRNLCRSRLECVMFWDKSHTLKEQYCQKTLLGFNGLRKQIRIDELDAIFALFLKKIDEGLDKAYDSKERLHQTYFINEVIDYEVTGRSEHMQHVKALKFSQKPLPLFLEAIVHSLRVTEKKEQAKAISQAVKKSALFDKKLKMYKVNAPLNEMPEEIGRSRVFTPGWLENESIWLHMEYKYMLELLKNGLYKEFFEDFRNVIVAFQDPARYGRSVLENSSFIASSAFPNSGLHGNGFVARLSGSTAEFVNIWLIMCAGHKPFYLDECNKLCVEFGPILPSWLFSKTEENGFEKNTFAFKFLNRTLVVYHNPKRKDTFGPGAVKIRQIEIKPFNKPEVVLSSSCIPAPLSYDLRNGLIERLDILWGRS